MSLHPVTPSSEAPTRPRAIRRVARAVPLATVLAGALVIAGCGGDDDNQEPPATPVAAANFNITSELAASVPADVDAFMEVDLKPEGDRKAAIDELVGLFGEDAGDSLVAELGLDDDDTTSFKEDIAPTLGERAGGFAMVDPNAAKTKTTKDDDGDGALVVQVKDREKLLASLDVTKDKSTKKLQIAGQEVYRDDEGFTLWVGEDLAVAGTEKAVTAAIQAQGGQTLDKNERFTTALKQVRGSDALALGWADMQRASALGAAMTALDDDSSKALKQLKRSGVAGSDVSGLDALEQFSNTPIPDVDATVAMALLPSPGELKLEFGGTQPKPATGSLEQIMQAGSDAVAGLPAGSWLALGGSMDAADGIPGADVGEQLKQIEELTGEKLPTGLTAALDKIKTVAVGIKGDSLLAIGGAAIVQTDDPAAANELLKTVERELRKDRTLTIEKTPIPGADDSVVVRTPDLPIRFAVGVKGDRFVLGLGAESVTAALEGAKTLSGDPSYDQAKQALDGDAPTLLINPAPLGQLLGDLPADGGDISDVVSGLRAIKLVASSSIGTGDTTWRGAFVLRYDAAQLRQLLSGDAKPKAGTLTTPKPGR